MEQQQKIVGCTCLDLFAVQTEHEWKNVYLWILNHEVNFTSKLCYNWKEVVTADRTDLFYCHKVLFLGIIFCVCVCMHMARWTGLNLKRVCRFLSPRVLSMGVVI